MRLYFRICWCQECWQCRARCRPLRRLPWCRESHTLEEYHLFKEPQRLREMFLNPYPALLMGLLHLHHLMLRRSHSPSLCISNQSNTPGINRLHSILSLCISHSLAPLPMSQGRIIIVTIQGLCCVP